LFRVHDNTARKWYQQQALEEHWSVRTLDHNVATQYYYRLLQSPIPNKVKEEMMTKTAEYQSDRKLEFIKNPIVAEFLGLSQNTDFLETDLEKAILNNLQKFLLELGKGFAFVARQKHIRTESDDYFIDLVFYNIDLRCYVLIDLKVGKLTHQDVGQMDMYVRMYDEMFKRSTDDPTIGIILCSENNEDVIHYSVLKDKDRLFAAKYLTYLPSKEELRAEIEAQKAIYYAEHPENNQNE
jgi:predicted nuclease of restriction endonuclease-like (RecB) superfamily